MPATTDAAHRDDLKRWAPGWLRPVFGAVSGIEAVLVLAQAALIAELCRLVFVVEQPLGALLPLALLLVLLARAGVSGLRGVLAAEVSIRVRSGLKRRMLDGLRNRGPADPAPTGRVLSAFDDQVEKLDAYYARFLPQQFTAVIMPVALVIAVFAVDWIAGVFLLLSAPLIPLFMVLVGLGAESRARRQVESLGRLSGWFLDRLRGAPVLRRFNAEHATEEAVLDRTEALRSASMDVLKLAFLSSAVLEFFASVAIAAVAIYVGMALLGFLSFGPAADLTLAGGLFVLLLAPEYFAPIRALSQGWHDRADARAAVDEVGAFLEGQAPSGERSSDEREWSNASASRVTIEGLCFAYDGRERVFDGLDLDVAAGQRIVLVGPSGGGKSTLIDLLAGFLVPEAGRIELDGRSTRGWDDSTRAAHIAWLGQRPTLFAGSLYDNIALGWKTADRGAIEAVAERAGVIEIAERLPDGLDAQLGDGGHRLSGGQQQRVALARTMLRPRPLILLDEPTAHLDPDGERAVLDALDRLLADRKSTVIVASHRPEVIAQADRVIRVEGGRLHEEDAP